MSYGQDDTGAIRRPSVSTFDPDAAGSASRSRRVKTRRPKGPAGEHGSSARKACPDKPKASAFSRIVELSAVRDRSTSEMRERLEQDGYDEQEARGALERAVECGIVDDMRFAEAFVRGRVSAGKGELVVRRDLMRHGIDASELPGWPDEYGMGSDEQCRRAVEFLRGSAVSGKDPYAAARRKLESKGYSPSVAHTAVEIWLERRAEP